MEATAPEERRRRDVSEAELTSSQLQEVLREATGARGEANGVEEEVDEETREVEGGEGYKNASKNEEIVSSWWFW